MLVGRNLRDFNLPTNKRDESHILVRHSVSSLNAPISALSIPYPVISVPQFGVYLRALKRVKRWFYDSRPTRERPSSWKLFTCFCFVFFFAL